MYQKKVRPSNASESNTQKTLDECCEAFRRKALKKCGFAKLNYEYIFTPKYRRQAIYGKFKADIGMILRKLCENIGIEVLRPAHANLKYKYGNRDLGQMDTTWIQ